MKLSTRIAAALLALLALADSAWAQVKPTAPSIGAVPLSSVGQPGGVASYGDNRFSDLAAAAAAAQAKAVAGTVLSGTTPAACDGSTDDTTAIASAATRGAFRIPGTVSTTCKTTYPYNGAPGGFTGPGRLVTFDGNPRAPFFTHLSAPPASYGNANSGITAFTGDLSQIFTHEHQWTGAATLGQPSSGYFQPLENSADVLDAYSESGFNASTSGNGGRTGAAARYTNVRQYGQGDLNDYFCAGIVASQKPGATSFLASPEIACLAGHLFGGANGAYIEGIGDLLITDNGFDIAAVMESFGLSRTKATEGLGAYWLGRYISSPGSMPIDAIDYVTGKWIVGYDMSNMTLGYWRLASTTMNSGGTGYTVGDVLTGTAGTAITPTVYTVTGVTSGGSTVTTPGATGPIATYSVIQSGIYTTPPVTQYTTIPLSGGTGTGANFAGQYDSNNAILLPAAGGCIKPGGLGVPNTEQSDIYGKLCIDKGGLNFGGLANTRPSGGGSNDVQFGDRHLAQGKNNAQFGLATYDGARIGVMLQGSGGINGAVGSSQKAGVSMQGFGSGTTAFRLTSDGKGANTQNVYNMLNRQSAAVRVSLKCIDTVDATISYNAVWNGPHSIDRGATASATTFDGSNQPVAPDGARTIGTPTTETATLGPDTALGGLAFFFYPPSGNTHQWNCSGSIDAPEATP